ncbi:MAG: FtsX-like permease family protein [Planctomycetota bacterium]
MKYHSVLTRRFLVRRFIPYAAVVVVAMGVFCLVPVMSVMEGFKTEMREHIRGSLSHMLVQGPRPLDLYAEMEIEEALLQLEHVKAVAPFIETVALFKSFDLNMCLLKGVDPKREAEVGEFTRYVLRDDEMRFLLDKKTNRLPEDREPVPVEEIEALFTLDRKAKVRRFVLFPSETDDTSDGFEDDLGAIPGVLVGIEALRSGRFSLGQKIELTSYSPTYEVVAQTFIVVGSFQTQVFEQDSSWIITPLIVAQNFLSAYDEDYGDYRYTGFSIRLDDYNNADRVKAQIQKQGLWGFDSGMILTRTWEDQRKNLLRAVDIEKKIVSVMMLLVVAFAGVVIFLILTVMVIEKTRDLGVLRSLGATRRGVIGLFLRSGMALCVIGTLLGSLGGYLFTSNINEIHDAIYDMTGWQLFPPDVYYLTEIPIHHRWQDWALIIGATLIFGFLASVVPAAYAAFRDPVKALRHD